QQQQQHHSQSSQLPTPQLSRISYQQQPVKKEKERFFQWGRRERKRREEEQQRQKQQEEEQPHQRLKQEQKDRERKQREKLEREQQQRKQEQMQQEKEEHFQRQNREKQRREEHKKRKEEPDQYQRRRKQEPKQQEEEQQQELQQRQLKQQRQEELQSQHYQFPFHEKRTRQQRKPSIDWFDGPAGHFSDDNEGGGYDDNAEADEPTQYGIQNPQSVPQSTYRESAYSRGSGNRVSVHSNAMSGTSRASSRTLILSPVPTPELHSNTSPLFNPATTRFHTLFHDWDLNSPTPPSVGSPAIAFGGLSRKSSKITLNKSDLNESSVLCLSSSEDEADEDEMEVYNKPVQQRAIRDSIATFDEGVAEIFIAKAVSASRGSSVPRVRNTSLPPPRISRGHSTSSNVRTPSYRPSNGIPTISEPDSPPKFRPSTSPSPVPSTTANPNLLPFDFQLPVPSTQNSIKAMNRRSRVIAVTRQEEELLEVIRQHGGNMPPNFPLIDLPNPGTSFFNPMPTTFSTTATTSTFRKSPTPSTDRPPSSQYGGGSIGDTSFLALSPGLPPTSGKVAGSTSAAGSDSSRSHHALSVSDSGGDHHSNPSPRVSLVHSDTFPSPSASWTSPRTPQYNPPQSPHQQQQQQPQKHYQLHSQQPQPRELTSPSGGNRNGSSGSPLHQHHVMLMHPQPLSSYPPIGLPFPLSTSSPPSPPSRLSSSPSPDSPLLSPPSPLPSVTAATPTTAPKTAALDADVVLPIEETKRHSRTRTDSSSAMVFGDGDGDGDGEEGVRDAVSTSTSTSAKAAAVAVDDTELPIWALGWSSETPGLAVVH
ncbi:hypothetical protein RJZ57_001918, partial [Blastomyces gilchristii]